MHRIPISHRLAICAFAVFAGAPHLAHEAPFAEQIERYTSESVWLSQASKSMQDFMGMLEPVFNVTYAVTSGYLDDPDHQLQARAAIETARDRLQMIHENASWMIDALPERPVTNNRIAADLISKVGDPETRADDIRAMSDAIISNFEASLSGDPVARDQGILEAVALLDELALINEFVLEIEAAHVVGGHPVMVHALRADEESFRAVVLLRQLELLRGLTVPQSKRSDASAALVEAVKGMRAESLKVTREAAAYERVLANSPYSSPHEKSILKEYQQTEEIRLRVISAIETALYQVIRQDVDVEALNRSVENVFKLVSYLDPKFRNSEQVQGRPAVPPLNDAVPEAVANL